MKPFVIFFLLIVFNIKSIGQKDTLSYTMNSMFNTYIYQKGGMKVTSDEFYQVLEKDMGLYEKFSSGKTTQVTGNIVATIGAGLIGWNIGELMFNRNAEKKYTTGLIGVGLLTVGIPLTGLGHNKSRKTLVEFNKNLLTNVYDQQIAKVKDMSVVTEPETSTQGDDEDREMTVKEKFDNACLIARLPVYGNKIKLLKSKIASPNTTDQNRQAFQKQLDQTIHENKEYFDLITDVFKDHFTVREVYFVPDSSFKSVLAGQNPGFFNQHGEKIDDRLCDVETNYYFITGKDKDQFLLVDNFLKKPLNPIPHRKNIFLPSFRKIFDRKNYIQKQVIYFNTNLSKLK